MNVQDALTTLRRHEGKLRALGVRHAGVFGSVSRGQNRRDSDLDIIIDFEPDARITIFDYVALKEQVAGLFDGPVDVVNRAALKPGVRPAAAADAVYAF